MARPTLYLIDGNSYLYRAFFAIPKFTTSDGRFTNATYGFIKMLMKVVNQRKPDLLAICFDAPGKSFRHEAFEDYKATRDRMPDELGPQIEDIKTIIDGFGIPRVEVPAVEADDALATMAVHFEQAGHEVYIVTSDKDMMQLVGEHVHIYDTMKEVIYTPDKVKAKMGVWPNQIRDLLGLMGDSSDNIPGVQGVGPKTAVTLLEQYTDMDGIYAQLEEHKGKLKERLEVHRELAYLSKELATVKTDVEVDMSLIVPYTPDWERLRELFRDLEFSSILKEISTVENHEEVLGSHDEEERDYRAIVTMDALDKLLKRVKEQGRMALDTEATSENPVVADLLGFSFSFRSLESYYVPLVEHQGSVTPLPKKEVLERLRPILEDKDIQKIGHNIKYDLLVLARAYRSLDQEQSDQQPSLF